MKKTKQRILYIGSATKLKGQVHREEKHCLRVFAGLCSVGTQHAIVVGKGSSDAGQSGWQLCCNRRKGACLIHMANIVRFTLTSLAVCLRLLQLACFAPPLEQQHVNAPLVRIAGGEFHLHPSMYGPFLLELADPLSRTTVEWDTPWLLCPPWNVSYSAN